MIAARTSFLWLLQVGVACGASPAAESPRAELDALTLDIRFHNYAPVHKRLMRRAAAVAQQAYDPAGVKLNWIDCTPALRGLAAPAGCTGKERATSLLIQIIPERMAQRTPVPLSVFAYAAPFGPKQTRRALLFWDRIRDCSVALGLDPGTLLGKVLAHEGAHLLISGPDHSSTGLMRSLWKQEDVRDAVRGRLLFTSEQLAHIREGVLELSLTAATKR